MRAVSEVREVIRICIMVYKYLDNILCNTVEIVHIIDSNYVCISL